MVESDEEAFLFKDCRVSWKWISAYWTSWVGREGGGENSAAGGDPRFAAIPGKVALPVLGFGPLLVASVSLAGEYGIDSTCSDSGYEGELVLKR